MFNTSVKLSSALFEDLVAAAIEECEDLSVLDDPSDRLSMLIKQAETNGQLGLTHVYCSYYVMEFLKSTERYKQICNLDALE